MPHDSHDHTHDHKHDHAQDAKPSHGGCCSHSHAAPAGDTAPALPSAPIAGASTAKYRIANMDCPTEERLIRNKLATMAGVVGLDFNLMNRVLDVHHTLPSLATVEAALHGRRLGAPVCQRQRPILLPRHRRGPGVYTRCCGQDRQRRAQARRTGCRLAAQAVRFKRSGPA